MAGVPRQTHYQMIHFLRKDITFADNAVVKTIGTVPGGSIILKPLSGVHVSTVFNAGTNNFLDIGTPDNDDLYGTDLSLLALGLIPLDEAGSYYVAVDTDLIVTLALSGTAATTGVAQAIIAYIPNN